MQNCIFCNIINKEIPSEWVYEDEQAIAFHDIEPQAPQHILIIPRQHIATLNDLQSEQRELSGHLIHVATQLAKSLNIAENGYRVLFNCNAQGGQAVYHIHLHLLGGRQLAWPPG